MDSTRWLLITNQYEEFKACIHTKQSQEFPVSIGLGFLAFTKSTYKVQDIFPNI